KDDYKHRMYWRELYSPEEAEQLVALISAAEKNRVEFIYAISPGLDITFSNPREVAALKRKLDQVKEFGCRSFSLLFDDIETEMCPADKQAFSSFAHAQVAITNEVYQHLRDAKTFLFCPTDYCTAFCIPNVPQSSYLQTVGEKLLPGIDILWTGGAIVGGDGGPEEGAGHLGQYSCIHQQNHLCCLYELVNDRLYSIFVKDRPTELIPKLRGVLTNPNCEFYLNFVAIHTLATWCRSSATGGGSYSPQGALALALSDWLQEFMSADQPGGACRSARLRKALPDEEPMQTDVAESLYVPGPGDNPLYTAEPLTLDDLDLLSDLFYLPYEHGATARSMLEELDWLKTHREAAAWRGRAGKFDSMCDAVVQMFNRLSNAPNRSVLYDLYNYICDIKSGVGLARAYVKTLGGQDEPSAQILTDDPEPWGFRGGLSGEFQRMLPGHGNRDLFKHPPMTAVYCIRPYCSDDKAEVQKIFKEMRRRDEQSPKLISDRLSLGDVAPSPQCALVVEDDIGVCGYALALTDAKQAAGTEQRPGSDALLKDYPSLVVVQVLPRVTDPSPARRMVTQLLSSIRSSGSRGVFCELRQSDRRMLDFYSKLGSFKHVPVDKSLPQDAVVMATKFQ
uniref:O-GlcNAcase like n=1 Tax=Xiphophorus couchianus TaxID=32473 RepID=A0A3B5M4N5_9TELE